ncbi:MAG: CHASE2 domain-containing protein [Candidatus Rokubacteria bacterium]|nr:CHASE2 domain-containing protein [Candidatus Rokubacteria bacterium]
MAVARKLVGAFRGPSVARRLVGGLLAAAIVVGLVFFEALEPIELDALDRLFRVRGAQAPTAPIIVVTVDEDTFDELDLAWPFPRALHGTLVEMIASGNPLAIGVDLVFPEPSVRGAEDDRELGESVARAQRVVLGAAITVVSEGFYVKTDANFPIPAIRHGAAAVAPVNLPPDPDAVIRRMALRHRVGEDTFDGFDFAIYKLAAANGLPVAEAPRRNIAIINHRGGRQTYPWVPYHRVVKGDVDPKVFEGKIVLIGATTAILHDLFPTPFERGGTMPGVEIHAHAIDTLVRGDRIGAAPWWVAAVLAVALAPLGSWLVLRLRAFRAFGAMIAVWLGLAGITLVAFSTSQLWIQSVAPTLALVLGYGATSIEHFIREQREKRRLSQFFSPDVLREIVRHPEHVQLGSARRLVTVFFSDLRGFTTLSERMEPEVLGEMLREYLSEMTEIVFQHKGTVDKYIGDCVMAMWNAPFDDPDHAVNAVRTALDFQERTLQVSAKWEEKLGGKIRNGCGINTGEAVVGTMGSRQRLEYTAIGDTVNLAARLESITKDYNSSIVISESTYDYVKGQFMTRELGAVTVKGKTRPVKIFAVLPTDIRRHPRAALDSAAHITLAGLDRTWEVRTRDISETGVALVGVPDDLEKGTVIEIRLEGGGLPKPLVVSGMIMWKRGDSAGVSFTELDEVAPVVSTYVSTREHLK